MRPPRSTPGPVARQVASLLWIFVAWAAGTVVFELTAMGGENNYVNIESGDDGFLGLFDFQRHQGTVAAKTDDGEV